MIIFKIISVIYLMKNEEFESDFNNVKSEKCHRKLSVLILIKLFEMFLTRSFCSDIREEYSLLLCKNIRNYLPKIHQTVAPFCIKSLGAFALKTAINPTTTQDVFHVKPRCRYVR